MTTRVVVRAQVCHANFCDMSPQARPSTPTMYPRLKVRPSVSIMQENTVLSYGHKLFRFATNHLTVGSGPPRTSVPTRCKPFRYDSDYFGVVKRTAEDVGPYKAKADICAG